MYCGFLDGPHLYGPKPVAGDNAHLSVSLLVHCLVVVVVVVVVVCVV